jgi:hypothetical protein
MRFSNELVALVAASSLSFVSAAPIAAPEANPEPHNYFRGGRGGDGNRGYRGYATPHFVSVGSWKRDEAAKAAPVQKRSATVNAAPMKRDEPGYGPGDRCKSS